MNKNLKRDIGNDDEIVGRILTRREALATAAKAGFGLVFAEAAFGASASQAAKTDVHLVASPQLEEGPFFVDEKLNRSNLLSGTQRESVTNGLPLSLSFTVHTLEKGILKPLKGAHVDVWHTDTLGIYSDQTKDHEDNTEERWLRGYQVTDAHGKVHFETIFPGWYPSRTPHIHLKIRSFSPTHNVTAEFTTQVFFEEALSDSVFSKAPYSARGERRVTNSTDGVYGNRQVDGTLAGTHLTLSPTKAQSGNGLAAKFEIALTAGNFNLNGAGFRGGPPTG